MIPLAATLFGLVVGSFVNVVIYRVPIKQSVVRPASHCPACSEIIGPGDNVPLISYVLLRGRCRSCGTRIPVRYPVVEASTGLLFGVAAYEFGLGLQLVAAFIFITGLVSLAGTDLEYRILPNVIVGPAALIGLTLSILSDPGRWWVYPGSVLLVAGGMLGIALLYPGGMGMGDVKMGGMLGAFLGPYAALAVFSGALFGTLTYVALVVAGKMRRQSALPFGVFLALGGIFTLFLGPAFWRTYVEAAGGI